MEIPIKMDDLGVPRFKETPIYIISRWWATQRFVYVFMFTLIFGRRFFPFLTHIFPRGWLKPPTRILVDFEMKLPERFLVCASISATWKIQVVDENGR